MNEEVPQSGASSFFCVRERKVIMSSGWLSVAEIFGEDVFNDAVMQERLPKKVYKKLKQTIEEGKELDLETADVIAHEMKEWAIEKGATHYTHWFQPLTGVTAEKHDSFISAPLPSGKVLMSFSGKELIKGEPDASSFPSGGLRATFEARGYTAWDCTSPAFVRKDAAGAILCIPTAFCSYTGEALDEKTPLLRSMEAINKESIRLLRLFGNTTSKKVTPSVGPEQEYFLVDAKKFLQRKDLIYTGRTLFGAMPPKGQELDDHYFGTIRQRVASYMKDVNEELWKLGVAAKTQHNEVAPAQHEIDFKYEEALHTADNIMTFKLAIKTIAKRHGLFASFMPKPKHGVSGSGMHINMSLSKDGVNIFDNKEDKLGLSEEAYYFIGGIMKHMKGMTVITNPIVNSYKRFVPGYEAPIYITWSATNRSPLIRIPAARGEGRRVELRNPDPSANPYLVLALCLAAGLDGIKNKIQPDAELRENVFELTEQDKKRLGIESLPADLHEAVECLKSDDFIREILGEHIYNKYIEAKEAEWNDYRAAVTQWEIDEYLYKF